MNKKNTLLLIFCIVLASCKTEKKQDKPTVQKELTIIEKVANASGFENWNKVAELQFTFNADRDTTHWERSWIWEINTNMVTSISQNDTITYNKTKIDSLNSKVHAGFINDKYWFMNAFNLIWDKDNFTYTYKENEKAPIGQKSMNKLTIVYGSEGGYTPGDAYDFYFEDDYLIKEWVFRRGNQEESSLATTWEGYEDKEGLLISTHRTNPSGVKWYFTNIVVKTK